MRLQFKKPLPEKIKRGQKIHTLREDPKRRWREGMMIDFVEGSRYKPTVFLSEAVASIQEVTIKCYRMINYGNRTFDIEVDCKELNAFDKGEFIRNDGFDTHEDFLNWFFPNDTFGHLRLRLIHWTDLKY
jgi:hypothetical protein